MDEREGPKLSQKGVSRLATHLQTHRKIKVTSDREGKDAGGRGTGSATLVAQSWEACAPGPARSLTNYDLECQFLGDSFIFFHPFKTEMRI